MQTQGATRICLLRQKLFAFPPETHTEDSIWTLEMPGAGFQVHIWEYMCCREWMPRNVLG